MKSPWSYAETPIIEDAPTLFAVHPRGSSKSVREMYGDLIRYLHIIDDEPTTDTFLWRVIEREDNYIGTIR